MDSLRSSLRRAGSPGRSRGIAIATALLVLTVISVIGLAIAAIGAQDLNLANSDRNYAVCRYAAEAGIAEGASYLPTQTNWSGDFTDKSLNNVPGVDVGYSLAVTNNAESTGASKVAADGTVVPAGFVYLYATGKIRRTSFEKAVGALYHVMPDVRFKYACLGLNSVYVGGTSSISDSFDSSRGPYSNTNKSNAKLRRGDEFHGHRRHHLQWWCQQLGHCVRGLRGRSQHGDQWQRRDQPSRWHRRCRSRSTWPCPCLP